MSFEKQPPPPLDINSERLLALTPLHHACYKGDIEKIDSVLGNVISYNRDEEAARHCVLALLEEEDSLNGWTPAHWAAFYGQLTCLMKLHISPNIGFDKSSEKSNTSPLHLAAQSGAVLCLKWLLECGASINRQDFMGETALHKAAKAGNTDSAAMLMAHKSAIELKNHRGCTPADLAELGNNSTLSYLIKRYGEQANKSYTTMIPSQQNCTLPISDLNSSMPLSSHLHSHPNKCSYTVKRSLSSCQEEPIVCDNDTTFRGSTISMNGESIAHPPPSMNLRTPELEESCESLSSGSSVDSGWANSCRMKRSLEPVEDDSIEEDMLEEDTFIHPDSKRRCFVSSQELPRREKYGDAYNNNIISSYQAVLAMRVEPLRLSEGATNQCSGPAPFASQSSSLMEHQEAVVAEMGYDSSVMAAFKNVFV